MRGKTPTNFVQPNCIMQLADSVSVAKIKIIYASRQRTLIWRSWAFNRRPMAMPVLDGPMTMPVLDGVKPMAITLPICGTSESLLWKRKKSIYCWTWSRPTWTFGESDDQVRDKSESKYQRVQDKSETITALVPTLQSTLGSCSNNEYNSTDCKVKLFTCAISAVTVKWPRNHRQNVSKNDRLEPDYVSIVFYWVAQYLDRQPEANRCQAAPSIMNLALLDLGLPRHLRHNPRVEFLIPTQ